MVLEPLELRRFFSVAPGVDGIAVLGDSYSDEYQFYPPARATASNWVEQLAQDSNVSFGAFSSEDPAGPRNAGFEFNWAVSGATSGDMISGGQHTGAAAQAASGAVDLVTMFIGGNDFRNVFGLIPIIGPAGAAATLPGTVANAATNIATAAGTVLSAPVVAANPDVGLVLTTLPKLSYLPEVRALLSAVPGLAPFVDLVDSAVAALNQKICKIAAALGNRATVADFAGLIDGVFADDKFKVGNVEVELDAIENPTNDPTFFVLADRLHPGTIGQGMLANLYVDTANNAFGTSLCSLSSHDILENAGLKTEPPVDVPALASRGCSDRLIADDSEDDLLDAEVSGS
jgi:phospholipase/lecithinase/hemolysin